MAIINGDSSAVVVDAVLTKKGRELLSKGRDYFKISKYCFADDEVDYGLWDSDHPNGSNYYGIKIENLPLMEASTDGGKSMRNKLISLNKDQTRVSRITGLQSSITVNSNESATITPNTNTSVDSEAGYTLILYDSTAASIVASGIQDYEGTISATGNMTQLTAVGKSFVIQSKMQATDLATSIVVTGNESGASYTITFTVEALEVLPDGSFNTGNLVT